MEPHKHKWELNHVSHPIHSEIWQHRVGTIQKFHTCEVTLLSFCIHWKASSHGLIKDMHETHVIQNIKLLLIIPLWFSILRKNLYSSQVNSKLKFSFIYTCTTYVHVLVYNTYSKRGGNIPQFKTKSLHSALSPAMFPRAHTALKSKASKWIYTCLQISFYRWFVLFTANIIE